MVNITLIAAVSLNGVIGNNNDIPWSSPEDLKHFKKVTYGHNVIMGRKTFESMESKPLKGRYNMVVTRKLGDNFSRLNMEDGVTSLFRMGSIEEAISHSLTYHNRETIVIGGGEIYKQTIGLANKLIISHIHKPIEGDVKFPEIDLNVWGVGKIDHRLSGDTPFAIIHYIRK